MTPDFEGYSLEELEDVRCNIDKDLFPERYKTVINLMEKIKNETHTPLPNESDKNTINFTESKVKLEPKHEPFYKLIFVLFSYVLFLVSQLFSSNQEIDTFISGLILFALPVHWVYAYIFNTSMHAGYHVFKANEDAGIRFGAFLCGVTLGVFLLYLNITRI